MRKAARGDLKAKYQIAKNYFEGKGVEQSAEVGTEIIKVLKKEVYKHKLRFNSIGIFNIRGIEDLTLRLENDLTVIIGINGSGKSTILDSISIILTWFKANIIKDERNGSHIKELDINNSSDVDYATIIGEMAIGNSNFNLLLTKSKAGKALSRRSTLVEIKALGGIYRYINSIDENCNLPLVAHYSVARSNEGTREDFAKVSSQDSAAGRWSKFDAYDDVLNDRHDFNEFLSWLSRIDYIARQGGENQNVINRIYQEIESTRNLIKVFHVKDTDDNMEFIKPLEMIITQKNKELENIYNTDNDSGNILASKVFRYIKHAIKNFLPDIDSVELVYRQNDIQLMLQKNDNKVSAQQLSQGEKSLLSLIGDLTRRLVLLNPSNENPLDGEGIVLIDEIDLHLHPSWQQTVILNLQKTFPKLQFIVTTHSPQVLSTVPSRAIRSLKETNDPLNSSRHKNNKMIISETPTFQTKGVMSTDILSRIMDIDPVPLVEEAKWVHQYYEMIANDEENLTSGLNIWGKILNHFGKKHPVVIGCENAIRLKSMKNRIKEMKDKKKSEDFGEKD